MGVELEKSKPEESFQKKYGECTDKVAMRFQKR